MPPKFHDCILCGAACGDAHLGSHVIPYRHSVIAYVNDHFVPTSSSAQTEAKAGHRVCNLHFKPGVPQRLHGDKWLEWLDFSATVSSSAPPAARPSAIESARERTTDAAASVSPVKKTKTPASAQMQPYRRASLTTTTPSTREDTVESLQAQVRALEERVARVEQDRDYYKQQLRETQIELRRAQQQLEKLKSEAGRLSFAWLDQSTTISVGDADDKDDSGAEKYDSFVALTGRTRDQILSDVAIYAAHLGKNWLAQSTAKMSLHDAVVLAWIWMRCVPSYRTLAKLARVNRASLRAQCIKVAGALARHFEVKLDFLKEDELKAHLSAVVDEYTQDEATKKMLESLNGAYIVDGSGFLELSVNYDLQHGKLQVCFFKGNKAMFRVQVIMSPLGQVAFVGPADIGRLSGDSAWARSGAKKAIDAHTKISEDAERFKKSEVDDDGTRHNEGTGAKYVMMGDQAYVLPPEETPNGFDWLLTRSAEESKEGWARVKNKPHVIVSPYVSTLRSTIERVFGWIWTQSQLLTLPRNASMRGVRNGVLKIFLGLSNERIMAGESPYISSTWSAKKAAQFK